MGPSAVDVLARGLTDLDEEIRSKSEEAIKRIRDNFFPGAKKSAKRAA
jgi:hypothetical protein